MAGPATKKIRATAGDKPVKITTDQILIPLHEQNNLTDTREEAHRAGSAVMSAPSPKDIDCIHGGSDISESLEALAEKYSLADITLATSDGLLPASSHGTPAAEDIT